jgi:hypothetical protein
MMSRRRIEPGGLSENSNVVRLQPPGGIGTRGGTAPAQDAPALDATSFQPDAITRDGLDLLKAFFAIDDAAARAALVILAQRLASHSPKEQKE